MGMLEIAAPTWDEVGGNMIFYAFIVKLRWRSIWERPLIDTYIRA